MTKRFLVPPKIVRSPADRQKYWEKVQAEHDYDTIWSMTEDCSARQKLIDFLKDLPEQKKILIPGCGSRTVLQEEICKQIPLVSEVGCCDFPGVIQISAAKFTDPKIRYYGRDISELGWTNEWDSIVAVNCVLSHDDAENRRILRSFNEALKPGGYMIGYFPTLISLYEIGHLEEEPIGSRLLERLDFKNNIADEGEQGGSQVIYTPLRLRYVIREAGFALDKMEIIFCDSEYFQKETRRQYGFGDEDIVIYEFFVVARKA